MAQSNRTFRIFVSSTFSDLVAERNALQERVFPRLRDLCQKHGARFQAIDLRWGVSNEASLDQQAMNICLGEVARCQQTSPRPNFIVLLGDRYGWCPPPSQIPAAEFERILRVIEYAEDSALLQEWYILDKNAVPTEWRLKPRERGSRYENYDNWQPVESRLHTILAAAAAKLNLTDEEQLPYTASATEQEIAAGALRVDDAPEHVSCFFRSVEGLPGQFDIASRDFLDLDEQKCAVDQVAHHKQEALKKRLAAYVPQNVYTYQARWTGDGITTDHIDQLCEDVYRALERVILAEIEHQHEILPLAEEVVRIRPDSALDDEGRAHRQFAEERLRFFVGRSEMLANIACYLKDNGRRSLAIVGAGGTGKSALLARAIQQTQEFHPRAEIVFRFIGATPGSSDGRILLGSLCREISRRYGKSDADVPIDFRELVPELGKRMQLASADRPLILFLDSLDQLSASQDARSLIWLPNELPEHVSVIASTREEELLKALRAKRALEKELGGLSRQEGDDLLLQWLASLHRTLQPAQRQEVLDKFERSQGNPLYLKLAFEEARLWSSHQSQEDLAVGVAGIIEGNMIRRLEDESGHGETLVSHALGYLAASRYGLAEDELVDLLSRDLEVYEWFFRQSYHLPADLVQLAVEYRRGLASAAMRGDSESSKDEERAALAWLQEIRDAPEPATDFLKDVLPRANGPRLPVVLWSRLSFDLAPYLTERLVDGSLLLSFYHRELEAVSKASFLADDAGWAHHGKLADYFRLKADPAGDGTWTGGSIRGLSELPYHLTTAGRCQEAYRTLTDFKFLEYKAAQVGILIGRDRLGRPAKTSAGVSQIQEDIDRLLGEPGSRALQLNAEQKAVLQEFQRALGREFHLTLYPHLLWQQLHNRLQWADDPVGALVAAERERRSVPGAARWVRSRTRFRESEALLRTLAGHRQEIHACAVSPDGAWIVSASYLTLKIWDATTGRELRTLTFHQGWVDDCAVSPDGTWIVSASRDETLKIWDAATGSQLRTLTGHNTWVRGCIVSPDGTWIVSADIAGTLKLWDAATGSELRTLTGHTEQVRRCAVSPDGAWIVSASMDNTLKLWDAATGQELRTLIGHTSGVDGCAVSPDGTWIVSASGDRTLKIWDATTGRELRTLTGHTDRVRACAVTSDGARIISASFDGTLKLWDAATGKELHTLAGHTYAIDGCAVSPDGSWVVSAGWDETLRLWDISELNATAAPGRELRPFAGHTRRLSGCTVSPNGTCIVSCSLDGTLKLWDVATGSALNTLVGHAGGITGCAVSPDGTWIVSASRDKTLKIWNAATGKELRTLNGHTEEVHGCAVSPDGAWIVSCSKDSALRVWDAATGQALRTLTGHYATVDGCAVSPDGTWIASAGPVELRLWEAATGVKLRTCASDIYGDNVCAVSPDGVWVVSAGEDRTLKLWSAATGQALRTLTGHTEYVRGCAVSPDGAWIVSASDDRTLRVWDAANGHEKLTLPLSGKLQCVALHPWQPSVACGDEDGGLHWLDLVGIEYGPIIATARRKMRGLIIRCPACLQEQVVAQHSLGNELTCPSPGCGLRLKLNPFVVGEQPKWLTSLRGLRTFTGHTRPVYGCAMSPDGAWIVSASEDGTLKLWDAATGRELRTLSGHIGQVFGCAVNPDGTRIVSAGWDRTLNIWSAGNGKKLYTLTGHTREVEDCAFSPDGRRIISASGDHTLKLWDAATGSELRTLTGTSWVFGCAVSPDGARIVSASGDHTVRTWDATTGSELQTLTGHQGGVGRCAVSPDGVCIVSASGDKTLKIWDAATGRELRTLTGHTDTIRGCAVSPDGAWIVSASQDYTLRVWDVATGREKLALSLLSPLGCVALHPWRPLAVCGDKCGDLYVRDLEGIEYGPIIVTGTRQKQGVVVRCPACQRRSWVEESVLGSEIRCPHPGCGTRLRVNPFVIQQSTAIRPSEEKRGHWLSRLIGR